MQCGDTFILDDDDEAKEHLHVVLTNPTVGDEVVTVAICTRRQWSENLVILDVGDHPFIRHPSVVAYRYTKIRKCATIEEAISRGQARARESISNSLLKRMQAALVESDFVANEVREFFKTCNLGNQK